MHRLVAVLAVLSAAYPAHAFCGFFVGKADASLFNQASQVAIARDGDRTVLTMAADYKGPMADFALVVPVPAVLEKEQIHVGDAALLAHLDAFSAPRLVEYHDADPCEERRFAPMAAARSRVMEDAAVPMAKKEVDLGVTVEAQYTVGEYDIVLLSATQSEGLETWLVREGYKMPPRASAALAPYIRQGLKFFVARVNLEEQQKSGFQQLRPIQIAYESPRFMLPIRLGMANADGAQDLIVFAMTKTGRVETSNYRTAKIPSDAELPESVQPEFARFYKATFDRAWSENGKNTVLTEYAWNMGWCDPCATQPLSATELRQLGITWLGPESGRGGALPVMLTRLHVRYDAQHFPEDLAFQETGDQTNFQARYIVRHPWKGQGTCEAARTYAQQLSERRRTEARTLAKLTGWPDRDTGARTGPAPTPRHDAWWKRIWPQ